MSTEPHPPQPISAAQVVDQHDRRWQAVLRRDAHALHPNGSPDSFFYGVTSTGVVCRPDCPSRRPRREHARFFNTVAQAEAAGFRTCQRCCPAGRSPQEVQTERLRCVLQHIERNIADGALTLHALAKIAGLSPFHLQRTFQAALGVSPAIYIRRLRAERFTAALSDSTVTGAVYAAGYGSPSHIYARATDGATSNPQGGGPGAAMSPTSRKRNGAGEHIRFTIADSPLDRMLVAATKRGVCLIAFADDDATLRSELQSRFSAAETTEDHEALAGHVRAVLAHLTEPSAAKRLPLDVRATAFQQRVWQALEAIPRGETRTYAQLAAAIGTPRAVRAVGTACGANPVAPVVPCHRVVGTNGSLTGYRWGKERKRKLLELEQH